MPDIDVERTVSVAPTANPAPLGLCGFALTTFVLSAVNAKLLTGTDATNVVLGLAFFYGGLAQLLAGMWEFKTGNTFGATAFSSYGAFWISFATIVYFKLIPSPAAAGWFLLGWTIFTGIMLLGTFRLNVALVLLFGLLFVTFLLLTIGAFNDGSTSQLGGYFGIATALVAWYTAAAGLLVSVKSTFTLPVGPLG